MSNTKKLRLNTTVSLLNRIVMLLSGLILPRLILLYFGSKTNGLIHSINQFLSIITFMDLGVGSVVQSSLYKPLANKSWEQVSQVLVVAKKYFKNISYFLIGYVLLLMLFFPIVLNNNTNYISMAFLIFSLSLGLFSQYFFGIINEFLLNADQKSYVQYGAEIVVVLLNLLSSAILITRGASIQFVKLISSLIYIIRPIYLAYYVKKNYNLDYDITVEKDPLPKKWYGMAQHIAWTIQSSTDIIVLTIFSTLENVSIYSVYYMVVQGIRLIVSSLTTELKSFYGNLYAQDEFLTLNNYFSKIELLLHSGITFLFGMTAVLIGPFVEIYTLGVDDVNYHVPLFSLLLVVSQWIFSLRYPYQSMILAAGHFKETQWSSLIEAGLNISISVILVSRFGLIGVAIGTIISMSYRTLYLVNYLKNYILIRPLKIFVKHIIIDVFIFAIMIVSGRIFFNIIEVNQFAGWLLVALILSVIYLIIIILINVVFYPKLTIEFIKRFIKTDKNKIL